VTYRPEIDGLRAIAVVSVILFHAGFGPFGGGYVGVDVFFVISGYLITSIIIGELAEKKFSILRFYERRARRILPALFFVMICTVPFAWAWMLPGQFKDFGQSLVAVTLFASNIFFGRETGYFGPEAEEKPLLHTWSLAVEEQYYVVFPVLLILLWRFGRDPAFYVVCGLALASLLLSEWGWRHFPSWNFYLAPTRAWELLFGSACAFLHWRGAQRANNALSAMGLTLILVAVFIYDDLTPFPSLYALLPVGGTVLIIMFASGTTWVARLLSTSPFVTLGLMSYSAYLWHQPLIAFAKIRSLYEPPQWLMLTLVVTSFVLAYFTWKFVETPFRNRSGTMVIPRRVFVPTATVAVILSTSGGLAIHVLGGLPNRFPAEIIASYEGFLADQSPDMNTCHVTGMVPVSGHPVAGCAEFMPDGRIDVAFLGDSHSGAISNAAQSLLLEKGLNSYSVYYSFCLPLDGVVFRNTGPDHDCAEFNKNEIEYLKAQNVTTVVVAARFTLYWDGLRFDNQEGGVEPGGPVFIDRADRVAEYLPYDSQIRRARVLETYTEQLRALADEFNVVLVYPIPEAGWNVPLLATKRAIFEGITTDQPLSTSESAFHRRNDAVIDTFDALDHPRIHRIKPSEALCSTFLEGRCINVFSGKTYYNDDDHLSNTGATLLAPLIVKQVAEILATRR